MPDDPKDPQNTSQPELSEDDDSQLDDLDPEEQGEDVIGGGYPAHHTVSSTNV
jgi:hypothetical protein